MPPSARSVRLGFEPRDMSGRTMTWLVLGLGGSVATAIGLMVLMLSLFHEQDRAAAPHLTPQQQARLEPPLPHLETHPHADLRSERGREHALLHVYRWLDPARTHARIPIRRAMALTAGHSLDSPP